MTACSYDYTDTFDFGYEVVSADWPITEYTIVDQLFPRIKYPFKKQFKGKETNFKADTIFKSRSEK